VRTSFGVVTPDTVKRHVSNLFSKLEVANRTQAVARARQLGSCPSGPVEYRRRIASRYHLGAASRAASYRKIPSRSHLRVMPPPPAFPSVRARNHPAEIGRHDQSPA
jgi:hypothetical protein